MLLIVMCTCESAQATPAKDAFINAQRLVNSRRYLDAIKSFDNAIALDSGYAEAYAFRGRAKLLQEERSTRNYQSALEDCTKAVQINPKLAMAFAIRAAVQTHLARYPQALTDCKSALAINPALARAYTNRGTVFRATGKWQEAIADYTKAISLDPEEQLAYRNRAGVNLEIDAAKALSDANIAVKLDPSDPTAYLVRSMALAKRGKTADGLPDLNTVIKTDPSCYIGYSARGDTWQALKQFDKAIKDYDRALELLPDNQNFASTRREIKESKEGCIASQNAFR